MASRDTGAQRDRASATPAMLILVDNDLSGDSRVIKQIDTALAAGYRVEVRGVSTTGATKRYDERGAEIILAAFEAPTATSEAPAAESRASAAPTPTIAAPPEQWDALDPVGTAMRRGWGELGDPNVQIIHANDARALQYAIPLAERIRARGGIVSVIYDAHEWVVGYDALGPARHAAAMGIEKELIGRVERVITVSDSIAELLRSTYDQPEMPAIVRNTPESPGAPVSGPSLRQRIRLAPNPPLGVYSGSMGGGRDLELCVEALTMVPDLTFAFVVRSPDVQRVRNLASYASELGVRDRVRFTRFVPQEQIVQYLKSADFGVIPFVRSPNNDVALPTKLSEYAVAGIPVVSSDVPALRNFIHTEGIGETYEVGDAADLARAMRRVLASPQRYSPGLSGLAQREVWSVDSAALTQAWAEALSRVGLVAPDRPSDPAAGAHSMGQYPTQAGVPQAPSAHVIEAERTPDADLIIGPLTKAADATSLATLSPSIRIVHVRDAHGELDPTETLGQWGQSASHLMLASVRSPVTRTSESAEVLRQVGLAEAAGLTVGLLIGGSELLPAITEAVPDADQQHALTQRLLRRQLRAEFLGVPTFSTSGLAAERFSWVRWLPLPIDPSWLAEPSEPAPGTAPGITVLDLRPPLERDEDATTTQSLELMTDAADAALVAADSLAPGELADGIRSADIVVDSLRGQDCSLAALHAAAAGRVVVGSGTADTAAHRAVIRATPDDASRVIAGLLGQPEALAGLGASARAYALTNHDGRHTRIALGSFYPRILAAD